MTMRENGAKTFTVSHVAETDAEYARALTDADTLAALKAAIDQFKPVANDAAEIVAEWTDADFQDWRKALYLERHGRFMGEARAARFNAVLMPSTMFRISLIAKQFHAPWGLVFHRLLDTGLMADKGGVYEIQARSNA